MFSAKALYSNVADTSEELSFSKGDVLEVLERDDNGWWMCSLKGKVGIAPGNRLQILSANTGSRGASNSGRNSPSASQVLPLGQKLPPSASTVHLGQKSPATDPGVRSNWHFSNKVVVPRKSGNVYVYDRPNRVLQDYDVPPARHDGKTVTSVAPTLVNQFIRGQTSSSFDSSCDALQNYDVPSSLRCQVQASSQLLDNYDTLPAFTKNVSRSERDALSSNNASSLIYDIPPAFLEVDPALASNRSSVLSVLSTGSHSSACSGHSSLGRSVSARSSVDVSMHEIYDVPQSSRVMSASETGRQLQTLVEQGKLDDAGMKPGAQSVASSPYAKKESGRQNPAGPPCSLKLHVDRDSYLEDYSVPRSDISQGSGDSGISVSTTDPFSSRSSSEELYDTPRKVLADAGQKCEPSLLESEELTYDVPNQINYRSRDINDSVESAGLELSFMELVDNGTQISNPTEVLVALQSTVLGHSSKLGGLISRLLSEGRNQEQELSLIKLTCLALKSALKEVLDFGSGGLVQAVDSTTNKELSEVSQLMEKVRVQQQYLNRHVDKLLTTHWPPRRLDKTSGQISELDDTLNTIGMLTEAVSGHLQNLTSFISQNSSLLFRQIATENGTLGPADLKRASKDDNRCRPPLPPATKTKPKYCQDTIEKLLQVQDRPLPPVPSRTSTTPDYRISRQRGLQAAAQVTASGAGLQANDSIEWNDDCDYVSIANEAEKEIKAREKLVDQKESDRSLAGCDKRQDLSKAVVHSGEASPNVSFLEKKESGPSPKCKEDLLSVVLTDPGVATSSGNTDRLISVSKVGNRENGHAVDRRGHDPQLIAFYAEQTDSHFTVVDSAVREFFRMIFSERVAAKEFLLRSKYVILAAHKLVYIGDTITRNSVNSSAQNQVALCANNLCDILKETVAATKTSALNFPQNLTQQKLIDCMKAVSHASLQLCEAIRSIAVQV